MQNLATFRIRRYPTPPASIDPAMPDSKTRLGMQQFPVGVQDRRDRRFTALGTHPVRHLLDQGPVQCAGREPEPVFPDREVHPILRARGPRSSANPHIEDIGILVCPDVFETLLGISGILRFERIPFRIIGLIFYEIRIDGKLWQRLKGEVHGGMAIGIGPVVTKTQLVLLAVLHLLADRRHGAETICHGLLQSQVEAGFDLPDIRCRHEGRRIDRGINGIDIL